MSPKSICSSFLRSCTLLLCASVAPALGQITFSETTYATPDDITLAATMSARDNDWRVGALVYQVLVDRFAPSDILKEKKHLYKAPRILRDWQQVPTQGHKVEGTDHWSNELEFWGGDLHSLSQKIDYLEALGVDVVYLNPIHHAFTNHKYDAIDYQTVSPEFGSRADVRALVGDLHRRGMKLVLDGVFNHMGSRSPHFLAARDNPQSEYRDWFFFDDAYKHGYRSWIDAKSLPELRLENKKVREYIYDAPDSVVQSYLADGVDGWRLDVAFDVGPVYLAALTEKAHEVRPGSLVVGEIWNYPAGWFPSVDGVMNFPARKVIQGMLAGKIAADTASDMFFHMIADAGIEHILKSWLLLDNHDTKRLRNMLPDLWQQTMAQVLQFTLPGSPNIYYGVELGMEGGEDPLNRAPMRWDLVSVDNAHLIRMKQLVALRKQHRALRIGNYRKIVAKNLLAFERYTDRAMETVLVLANPSDQPVSEMVMVKNPKIMNGTPIVDAFTGEVVTRMRSSLISIELAPQSIRVLKPGSFGNEWSPYKRVM